MNRPFLSSTREKRAHEAQREKKTAGSQAFEFPARAERPRAVASHRGGGAVASFFAAGPVISETNECFMG